MVSVPKGPHPRVPSRPSDTASATAPTAGRIRWDADPRRPLLHAPLGRIPVVTSACERYAKPVNDANPQDPRLTVYATPKDLLRAPWWPSVATQSAMAAFEQLPDSDAEHATILFIDLDATFNPSLRVTTAKAFRTLYTKTLGEWAARWHVLGAKRPPGHLVRLRPALAALVTLLAPPPAPELRDLGPFAAMNAQVLARRTTRGRIDAAVSAGLPYGGAPTTVEAWMSNPDPRVVKARLWLEEQAKSLASMLAADAPALATRLARYRARADQPMIAPLLALRDRLAETEVACTTKLHEGVRARWLDAFDSFEVEHDGIAACLRGPCMSASVKVSGSAPTASCHQHGTEPCRLKLLAVEHFLDALGSSSPSADQLRASVARAPWERLLSRLSDATRAPARQPTEVPEVVPNAWLLKLPQELGPAVVAPGKKGGFKAKPLSKGERDRWSPRADVEALALALLVAAPRYSRYATDDEHETVARALRLLANEVPIYVRHESEVVRARVVVAEPEIAVEDGPAGSTLTVRWGGERLTHGASHRGLPHAAREGGWGFHFVPERALLVVGRWSAAAVQAAQLLWVYPSSEAARPAPAPVPIPPDALPRLAEVLLDIAPRVAVAKSASWLGEAFPPAPNTVLRLGFEGARDGRVLVVEGRVAPLVELGALVPGDGESIVPVRREGRLGHVARDFAGELAAVARVAADAGLPEAEVRTTWRVEGLEPALELLQRIEHLAKQDPTLALAWQTVPPRRVTPRKSDKLRLTLGLRRDWLDVGGGFTLDGGELPLLELLAALRDGKRFVALDDDRIVELTETLHASLAPLTALARTGSQVEGGVRASPLAAPLLAELAEAGARIEGPPEWLAMSTRLREAANVTANVPGTLRADLRPYQREGLEWLVRLAHWAPGACLADDMGLGKTLEALALLLFRAPLGRALVVAPTSVVANWLREAARFAPTLACVGIHRGTLLGLLDEGSAVTVTSWDLLVRHEARFAAVPWATVVFDEAHAVKNAATKRSQVARALASSPNGGPSGGTNEDSSEGGTRRFVVALTGTPVENRPSELWSLMQVVAPGLLGSAESFRETFARPIEARNADAARRLARLVRPFILRRRKSEVAHDLPTRTDMRVDIVLTPDERARYEKVRKAALKTLAADGPEALAGGKGILKVLVVLTRLRQLACHARLVEPKAPDRSSKIERLVELMLELRDEGRKALVFSQFTELLAHVRTAFDAANLSYAYLDGSTPPEQRVRAVDTFQSGAVDAFLLSLKAGGVGLNLTAATEVIHLDPWWNPAVEDQATDRAHRIGQEKPVTVYRLVAQGTIEEQILGLHGDKRAMVASLLEGTASAAPVTAEELMALLSEDGLETAADAGGD